MERYIIWDVDGTVVDTRRAIAESYLFALGRVGIAQSDGTRIFAYVGRRSTLIFSELHGLDGERLQLAIDAYKAHFEGPGLALCALYPGMDELLRTLKSRGALMSVASARSASQLSMLLRKLGIEDLFDCIHATETDHQAADKPKLVSKCIAFMGVKPSDCVMVGDRIFDIEGGQRMGTRSIGVTYGFGSREELLSCAPDYIVDDVTSLSLLLLGEQT